MECLGAILGPIVAETCRCMFLRVHRDMFRSNPKALNTALGRLKKVQAEVNEDLTKLGIHEKSLEQKVGVWLKKVDENLSRGELILEKCCSRARLFSCKIMAILKVIKRLEEEGQELISTISMVETSIERVEKVLGPLFHPQKTATQMLDKIKDSLKKKNVQKIGVWGMGGVGKTTLVRTLNNELRKNASTSSAQQFALVIWVTVSKDFNLRKVQMDIARRLEVPLPGEKMENTIYNKLAKLKSFLLILDDVWEPIELDSLGIPLEDFKDSKLVLTSRSLEVCQQMRTNENIRVECLQEQEAWELFCYNAGEVANSINVKPIAEKVCSECGGLPLAIITIGRNLCRKGRVEEWKDALNKLKKSAPSIDTQEKIYKILKFSYDFLQDKMKSCFLSCALFPEDYLIQVSELIRHWIVEGFLDGQDQYEDLMNEGLVERLKDSCLLEKGNSRYGDAVKMHDVVRNFAMWIMSSPSEGFHSLVMAGRDLQNILQDKFVPSVQRVSCIASQIDRLPDRVVKCAETSVLLLQENSHLEEVPDGFLRAFPNLTILNFSGTRIRTFPYSFSNLHNLHSLVIRKCETLEYLPSLESLVKLQFLDLHESGIREFPRGMSNLRYIFLSKTYQLESIPAGTISQLSSLEVLDMAGSVYEWRFKGQEIEGQATLEELARLLHLQFLGINLPDVSFVSNKFNSLVKRLKRFQFHFSPNSKGPFAATGKRCLSLHGAYVSQTSIGWLLVHVTSLNFHNSDGIYSMLAKLVESNSSFVAVKSLSIYGGRKCVFEAQLDLFPNLEKLSLRFADMGNIQELNGLLGLKFQKLKLLRVVGCSELKRLFSYKNLVDSLPNLEQIEAESCETLKELFNFSSAPVVFSAESWLPKLSVIRLKSLPKLSRIFSDGVMLEHPEELEVKACPLVQKALPIIPSNAGWIEEGSK